MSQTKLKKEKWIHLVKGLQHSGLSQKEYCVTQGVALSTFRYHLTRLRREPLRGKIIPRFLPVEVRKTVAVPNAINDTVEAMIQSCGVRMRFSVGADCDYVGRLLAAVARHSAC